MALQHSPSIVTSGLVYCSDAANLRSYPGTGTTLYDLSGNGYTGSMYAGVSYSSSNLGSLAYSGTTTAVTYIGTSTRYLSTSMSVEAWVKSTGLGSGMSAGGIFGITYGFIVNLNANGSLGYYMYNTDSGSAVVLMSADSTGVNFFNNSWHHLVCTKYPSGYAMYVDGVLNTSGSTGSWSGTNIWVAMETCLGLNPNNNVYYLSGSMGPARIYNIALTAAQVSQNYNALRGRYGI